MHNPGGRVPHFTLRPHPLVTLALVLVPIVGTLIAMSFFAKEIGTGHYRQQGIFTIIVTSFLTFFLILVATSKLWFSHLWKKNSTHKRHQNHTKHHPTMRDQQFRQNRR